MPELPEVETICQGLAKALTGKRIEKVTLRRPDLRFPIPPQLPEALKGKRVEKITRRAKYMLWHMQGGAVVVIHLGMSGRMLLSADAPSNFTKHDHAVFYFDDGGTLVFNDARRFGMLLLLDGKSWTQHALFSELGPEPLEKTFSTDYLLEAFQGRAQPVKLALMDQHRVVGVGNIYASEALFLAGIDPTRQAGEVSKADCAKLVKAVKKVLQAAIESGGSTLRDYVRSSGELGYFQHHFSVYDRAKNPCPVCSTPIAQIKQGGRSTFFCPTCQK